MYLTCFPSLTFNLCLLLDYEESLFPLPVVRHVSHKENCKTKMQCGFFKQPFFLAVYQLKVSLMGLSKRGSTRSLKSIAKINIFHQQLAL